jgi:transcriptional regulator with XRE-family HTH domain
MSNFSNKLRENRERLGMKQRILAERVGLTPGHLNKIEKGTRKPPGVETMLSIVEVLRLSRNEAEELIQLAGYSPRVLQLGGELERDARLEPSIGTPTLRHRPSGVLPSPLMLESAEGTTIGEDIDNVLDKEYLSHEELERLRQVLVPHVKQLVLLIRLSSGEMNEEEI